MRPHVTVSIDSWVARSAGRTNFGSFLARKLVIEVEALAGRAERTLSASTRDVAARAVVVEGSKW